jgi:methylmalonyl-CoA/ethylmalonyl-CoA epimerase
VIRGIAHIGIAVGDADRAARDWAAKLGEGRLRRFDTREQEVVAEFVGLGNSEIELIEPTNPASGVATFLRQRGPGLHHVCLDVDDVGAALEHFKAAGVTPLTPEPRTPDIGDEVFVEYAWLHPSSFGGVLVELVQLRKPR